MAEGPSKVLGDVTPPSGEDAVEEKEETLDFDDDTLTGELSAAFSSKGDFVIMFPVFQTINTLLDFFSLSNLSFFLKIFRVTFICVMALRNEKNSQGTRFVILQCFQGKSCHFMEESLINCWDQIILYSSLHYFFNTLITIDSNFQFNEFSLNSFVSAIVEVYKNEGDDVCIKEDFLNAIYFYTEGIKVKCGNKELKAKLYNDRATVHFKLGENLAHVFQHSFCFFTWQSAPQSSWGSSWTHVCV